MQLQTYQYDLFRDHFSVRIFDDNRLSSYYDKPYHRIERIDDIRTFLMVQADHTLFCFRKPDLKQGSILFRLYRDKPYQKHYAPVYGMWKTLSILSFILAIVAHPMSIFLSVTVTSPSTDISAVWKTAIFLLFPIVSIVVGCILKSKGMVYKKNLVVGIIMTIVIALTSLLYLFVFTAFKNGLV